MRSSTVAFAVTVALANSASVLAAGGSAPTITYATPTILQTGDSSDIIISSASTTSASTTSLSELVPITPSTTSLSELVPITTAISSQASSSLSSYASSFSSFSINYVSSYKPIVPSGSAYSSGSVSSSSVSGKPGVYSNSTLISTATASGSGVGASTATAVTQVPGATTASASASASSSGSAANALSVNGASWSVGSLMLGGMAVIFGFF